MTRKATSRNFTPSTRSRCSGRPTRRRCCGALLPDSARVRVEVLEPEKRPVAAVADHDEVRAVCAVDIQMDHGISMQMLFDPGHSLDERILREQFGIEKK